MTAFSHCLLTLVVGQLGPGPVDAVRTNQANLSVDTSFELSLYRDVDASVLAELRKFTKEGVILDSPYQVYEGEWECDGSVQRYQILPPKLKGARVSGGLFPLEYMFDTKIYAHRVARSAIEPFHVSEARKPKLPLAGPFAWWRTDTFPAIVEQEFADTAPTHSQAVLNGSAFEVEVYRKPFPGGWYQLEVYYDPSMALLPRFSRVISNNASGTASVKDVFITDYKRVGNSGLVPTEWFDAGYRVPDFPSKYGNYNAGQSLSPAKNISIGHLKVEHLRPLDHVIASKHQGICAIIDEKGKRIIDLNSTKLTIPSLRGITASIVRKKLMSVPLMPVIDKSEKLVDPNRKLRSKKARAYVALGASLTIVLGLLAWQRRRYRGVLVLMLPLACGFTGCSKAEPTPRIAITFKSANVIYSCGKGPLTLEATVTNRGNVPLRILKVHGGCSCRRVDNRQFPHSLQPKEGLSLSVIFDERRQSGPQVLDMSAETDHGTLRAPVRISFFPDNVIKPTQASVHLTENEEGQPISIIHEQLVKSKDTPAVDISVPTALKCTKISSVDRPFDEEPDLIQRTTEYAISIKSRQLGLFKERIILTDKGTGLQSEFSILWKRVPFLSSIPEKVFLIPGGRGVRVFLNSTIRQ